MDYYQFFSQLNQPSGNQPNNDLISLPGSNNNVNNNNDVNSSQTQAEDPNFASPNFQDILEKQKKIKEMLEKKKEESQYNYNSNNNLSANSSDLSLKVENFMRTIEKKLETLEASVSSLSQEFQSFSYHQSNYNNDFLTALSSLSNDISSTKNTIAQVSTVSTLSKSSSFSISPAFADQMKGPSQEDIDAEIAKKLQEEFDRLAVSNNRPTSPPSNLSVNNIFPVSQSNNLYPISGANNIYGTSTPTALPPVHNSSNTSSPTNNERGECPFCNLSLPLKELQLHVESHLSNNESPPPSTNTNSSLWNKLFGKSAQPPTSQQKPPVNQPPKPAQQPPQSYVYPRSSVYPMPNNVPQGSMIYRPMPGQPMPGQPMPQPMPGQPMPGQPMPGQPMPGQPMPGQLMPGQPMPGQPMYQPQIIYVNPDGTPIYPQK